MKPGEWIKFSNGTGGSNCVEVMLGHTGAVYVRHSKRPSGERLAFTPDEWDSFLAGVRQGVFDR